MAKRIFSILLAVCLVAALVPAVSPVANAAAKYDANAALAYAKEHWNDGQGLCAEFVSRCVIAGGLNIGVKTGTGGCWKAICDATGLSRKTLKLNSNGYATQALDGSILAPGDVVVQWCNTHSIAPHIMICGGYDSSGIATFYAHNGAMNNQRYDLSTNLAYEHTKDCDMGGQVISLSTLSNTLYWPVPGHTKTSQGYTPYVSKDNPGHPALDISDSSIGGANIVAAKSGKIYSVYTCTQQHYGSSHTCDGFGTGMIIKGDDGRFYQYAHMKAGSIPSGLSKNVYVTAGTVIGKVGTTGNSSGNHLHFGIADGTSWHPCNVDPAKETYYYSDGGSTPSSGTVSVKWSDYAKIPISISNTDATLSRTLSVSGTSINNVSEVGITIYNGTGTAVLTSKSEKPIPKDGVINMFYYVNDELKYTLTKNTQYVCRFHAVVAGKSFSTDYTFVTGPNQGYTVSFNSNGGSCSQASKKVPNGAEYGTLPTAARTNYTFDGWYTAASGGTKITGSSVAALSSNITLYAHWTHVCAKGHSYQTVVTPATCTEQGYTTYTCSVCGHSYAGDYKEAKGHTKVTDKAVAATCVKAGLTEGAHCSVCSKVLVKQEAIPATGKHTYKDELDTTCEVCGYTREVDIKIETTPMYRLYNPNSGEHFYTGSIQERDLLVEAGWNYEGIGWYAPTQGGDPVYRVYNPNSGDHHYTMSWTEIQNLVSVGWQYEGVAWNSASAENEPQFRLYNPNADCGSHHYTSSVQERDYLVSLGWKYEGIAWYGYRK